MGKARSSTRGSGPPRIERKIIEKNRRNKMKTLYSSLISLLPDHTSKMKGLALPDQIDEVLEYIKSLKIRLEKIRRKKESLSPAEGPHQSCITFDQNQADTCSKSPLIEVQDMGPNLGVVLANGLQDYSIFHDIIRLLHQHGVEIASSNFSRDGNSTIQILHDKVEDSKLGLGSETISRKLKELVCGNSSSGEVVESKLKLWDYEYESNLWEFEIPAVLPAGFRVSQSSAK